MVHYHGTYDEKKFKNRSNTNIYVPEDIESKNKQNDKTFFNLNISCCQTLLY